MILCFKRYMVVLAVVLLFTACGRQHNAESAVQDFIEANHSNAGDVEVLSCSKIDSTKVLSDSAIAVMQHNAAPGFNKGIEYPARKSRLLYVLRTTYLSGSDTCGATFYLNSDMQVVALKPNAVVSGN